VSALDTTASSDVYTATAVCTGSKIVIGGGVITTRTGVEAH